MDGLEVGGAAGGCCFPRGLQVGQQDPPGHPVHDEVMHDHQDPSGPVGAGIEVHHLHHPAPGRGQPGTRGLPLTREHLTQTRTVQASQRRHG